MPDPIRQSALSLREIVFNVADEIEAIQNIDETLKWGQPAYLPTPKTGTTLRIWQDKSEKLALFVPCTTRLVSDFASTFPGTFAVDGTRAICLERDWVKSGDAIRFFIHRALTYHMV